MNEWRVPLVLAVVAVIVLGVGMSPLGQHAAAYVQLRYWQWDTARRLDQMFGVQYGDMFRQRQEIGGPIERQVEDQMWYLRQLQEKLIREEKFRLDALRGWCSG